MKDWERGWAEGQEEGKETITSKISNSHHQFENRLLRIL